MQPKYNSRSKSRSWLDTVVSSLLFSEAQLVRDIHRLYCKIAILLCLQEEFSFSFAGFLLERFSRSRLTRISSYITVGCIISCTVYCKWPQSKTGWTTIALVKTRYILPINKTINTNSNIIVSLRTYLAAKHDVAVVMMSLKRVFRQIVWTLSKRTLTFQKHIFIEHLFLHSLRYGLISILFNWCLFYRVILLTFLTLLVCPCEIIQLIFFF